MPCALTVKKMPCAKTVKEMPCAKTATIVLSLYVIQGVTLETCDPSACFLDCFSSWCYHVFSQTLYLPARSRADESYVF